MVGNHWNRHIPKHHCPLHHHQALSHHLTNLCLWHHHLPSHHHPLLDPHLYPKQANFHSRTGLIKANRMHRINKQPIRIFVLTLSETNSRNLPVRENPRIPQELELTRMFSGKQISSGLDIRTDVSTSLL